MPDIFLSYNREDQALAKLFAEAFEHHGFRVWWDVGLRTGEAYDEVTETALRTAKAVVVLWSKKSVASRWVRAEATLADRNKNLVPCMIEPCERPIMFELTQTAELSHWRGQPDDRAWQAFLKDIRRVVMREANSPAATPPQPAGAKHKLSVILAAEVADHARLMAADRSGTMAVLTERRRSILAPVVSSHGGRIARVMEDGALIAFGSAAAAVTCGMDLQRTMGAANAGLPADRAILLRVGVGQGDLIVEAGELRGDGASLALALAKSAGPGDVLVSRRVQTEIRDRPDLASVYFGNCSVSNHAGPIEAFRVTPAGAAPTASRAGVQAEAVLQRPAVAVLPFSNLSGDPAQDYFVDGITEDLITALSQWRWFPVMARNSTFVYKGRAVDVTQVGKDLRVRYVLEGSVRRSGSRMRITAQLIEAATAHHIWAQTYDRQVDDVFVVQDEITRAIIGAIEPQLARAEQQRAARKLPENLDAWDLSIQALARLRDGTVQSLAAADGMLTRAVAMDGNSSYAQSLLALTHFQRALNGWLNNPTQAFLSTYDAARAAVALDDGDWLGHALLGIATLWCHRDYDRAIAAEERAITLNPSAAMAYHFCGCVLTFNDQPEPALQKLMAVLQLDPRFQLLPTTLADIGLAHFMLGDDTTAIQYCERAIAEQRESIRGWQRLSCALARSGRIDEARSAFAHLRKLQPGFGKDYLQATYPFRSRRYADMLEDAFRLAGWEG